MSDALSYLLEARPEVMGHYFKFIKGAGDSLEPKTRALISVITKVDAQTERGFRQYLSRALREGASGNEVLDALLMAFPSLGLSKIIWAIDILLSMDLPEFSQEALAHKPGWHVLEDASRLDEGQSASFSCDGRDVFIHRQADNYHVYDNRCPHQGTHIPAYALKGHCLTCPLHGWEFDLRSGACRSPAVRQALMRLTARVSSGQVQVWW